MPYLVEYSDASSPGIHELKLGSNKIGRGLDNDIVLMHTSLSRHHAELAVSSDHVFLRDLGSLNHTYVNGEEVEQCELREGDLIRYGSISFKFVWALNSLTSELQPANNLPTNAQANRIQPVVESRSDENDLPILSRLSPEQTHVELKELLAQDSPQEQGTVIKLRQQDSQTRIVDKLKILLEVSKQLSSPHTLEGLLGKILDLSFEIMDLDRGVILLANEQNQQLEQKAFKFRAGFQTGESFYSKTITNFVYQSGEGIITSDASQDQRFFTSRSIVLQDIQASMCVPLQPKDRVIGVLYVDNLSLRNVYSEEDLEFLTGLANQAAIAIDNAQLQQKIQDEMVLRTRLERFFPKTVWKKLREEQQLEIVERDVTVVFADISRFTEMSSQMEPRRVIEMLNEYFTVMVEGIVFKYEGTLEQYIGDALLAVWGAPYQKPDDAERGVQAAIAMQKAVYRLNQEWASRRKLQIQIHIGINSGKVAAGNIGSQRLIQYGTIGDTTNVSCRICNVARPGEILLSQTTLDKLPDTHNLSLEKLSPVRVKGKKHPIQLHRLHWN